jgi:hypothetical protein
MNNLLSTFLSLSFFLFFFLFFAPIFTSSNVKTKEYQRFRLKTAKDSNIEKLYLPNRNRGRVR